MDPRKAAVKNLINEFLSELNKPVKAVVKTTDVVAPILPPTAVQSPVVVIPSRLNAIKEAVRQSKGGYGARRVERAADEVPNLERLYKEQAIRDAFLGDNAKALMTMNPRDFERYAKPLDARFTDEFSTRIGANGEQMSYREYMEDYLPNVGGFDDVPFLSINKEEQGLPLIPFLTGHEGRHRNRVMANQGEQAGLVQLLPRAELREPFPRRYQEDYLEALKKELGLTDNMVYPEKYSEPGESVFDNQIQRPAIKLPDIYAEGGEVQMGSNKKMPNDEAAFQNWIRGTDWFKEFKAEYNEEPDLDTKDYDYRAAWKAGLQPERYPYDNNRFHWPSSLPNGQMLKSADHPTAWKEYFMRETGVNPDALGLKTPEDANIFIENISKGQEKAAGGEVNKGRAASIGGEKFYNAALAAGLPLDNDTLNKIVDLVNAGHSVSKAAQLVKGGSEVHMADGGDTMLAELMERYNTPLNKSRYSAGIFDSKAPGEVRSVTPTVKERMASGLQAAMEAAGSDRSKARQRAQTIVGGENSRLPLGYGVLDIGAMVNPVVAAGMIPLYGEEAIHNLANVPNALKRGDIIGAGVETGFGLMDLIPAVGQGKRVAKGVAKGIKDAVTSDAGYDLAQKVLNATGTAPMQIMIGPKAKTFRHDAAALAAQMEQEGKNRKEIWRATKTMRAPDNEFRQELSDLAMRYNSNTAKDRQFETEKQRFLQAANRATSREELDDAEKYFESQVLNLQNNPIGKAQEFIEHPELFEAYPELSNYVFRQLEPTNSQFYAPESVQGYFSPGEQRITINSNAPNKRSTALHELQHAIQEIEGWQGGSSPEQMAARMAERDIAKTREEELLQLIQEMQQTLSPSDKNLIVNEGQRLKNIQDFLNKTKQLEGETNPYDAYRKVSGEEEARMVQQRRNYPEEKLAIRPPYIDYETDPSSHITDFATGGAVMMAGGKDVTKEAIKQGIKTAVTSVDDFIKKLYGNKPTGEVNYVTAQEGPFYRINPVGAGEGQASRTGVREVTGTGEGVGPGGTGAVRGKVAKRYSPEEVARLVRENNIARRAAEKFGGTQTESLLTTMPPTSLAKQGAIGRAFMEASTDNPQYKQAVYEAYGRQMPELMETIGARDYDDLMEKAYRQLNYETAQQFNQMPVNMSFHRAGEGDYRSSGEMLEDVHGNQHLYVFQGGEPHNMMSDVDPRTGLNQTEQFRAVHDLFGHAVHGNEFGPKGEELAFGAHSQMYSPLARIALATETRGQNSVVNYTPLNVELKAELAKLDALRYEAMRRGDEGLANEIAQQKRALYGENFQYSPNRGLLLPPEFTDPMYEGGLPEYMKGIFRPSQGASERLTHFSHDPSLTMTDPSRYGTGIRGEELYRLQGSKAPVMDRTYFYRGDDPRPEAGLGRYRYGTQGEDLYSMASDPERLGLLAREANRMPFTARSNQGLINEDQALTDFERLAKEYGYEGLLGDRAAIMYNPATVERYAHGGEVHMAPGGNPAKQKVKEVIKSGAEAIDDFLNSLKTRGTERVSPNYTNTALSDQQQRLAEQIAQANPKLTAEDIQKKSLQQAQKKLEWERTEKPGVVKSYGALTPTSYSANKLQKMRNTNKVVQDRIDEANRFLDQPTEAWTPPPPELQAFDRSLIKDALAGFPGVQQSTFPRDIPSRSSTSYVEELYEDPQNRELIKKQIMRGLPLGGETFYASLYPVKQATLEAGMAPDAFERWIYSLAPASARNSIMNEMAVGQFLRDMNAKGIPLTEANVLRGMEDFKNTYGMGLPLMPIHRQGVADVLEGGRNLRDMSLANIPTNYKIPTYGTQKAGDFGGSVVLDVHEASGETLGSRYHPYFSEQGGFSNSEYHPGEQGMLSIARELGGLPGGMAQAGRWFGGGELTGLISPRGDALDLLEKQIAYTLHNQGRQANPANIRKEVLDQIRTGEGLILPWWTRGGMPDYRTTGLQRKEGGDVSMDDFLSYLESID
jgi:hypothetical protein